MQSLMHSSFLKNGYSTDKTVFEAENATERQKKKKINGVPANLISGIFLSSMSSVIDLSNFIKKAV